MNETQNPEYEQVESSYVRQHLSELIDAVLTGRSYIVTRHGRPIAQLVPVSAPATGMDPHSGQGKLIDRIRHHSS